MAARHSLNLLTTSTALVALLAACGGGGGSQRDKIVSSSPVPPTTLNTAVATPPAGPGRTPQPDGNESAICLTCPTAERNPARHPTRTNACTISCHRTQRLQQGRAR